MQLDEANDRALTPGSAAPAPEEPARQAAATSEPTAPNVSKTLQNVLRILVGLAKTSTAPATGPDDDISSRFVNALKGANIPDDAATQQGILQELSKMNPEHIARVMEGLEPEGRQLVHQQALLLSMALQNDLPAVGQAISLIRLLMYRILPALRGQGEDEFYGTSKSLQDDYRLVDHVAQMARPDENNPRLAEAARRIAESQTSLAEINSRMDAVSARFKKLGFDVANEASDAQALKDLKKQSSGIMTVLIILSVLLVIVVVVLIVLYVKKCRGTPSAPGNAELFGGRLASVPEVAHLSPGADFSFPTIHSF